MLVVGDLIGFGWYNWTRFIDSAIAGHVDFVNDNLIGNNKTVKA